NEVTNGSGAYDFTGLAAGTYSVQVDENTVTSGFIRTGGTNPQSVTLAAGEDYNDADFGFQQQDASIGDFLWRDLNGDGVQDSGEAGITGVTVYLDLNSNGNLDGGEPSESTDGSGAYDFTDLAAGIYSVRVDESSLPGDVTLSTANLPILVSLAAGEDYNDGDFGYRPVPVAAFSGDLLFGCGPLTVSFTDTSLNTTEWVWDFGDGNSSTEQHPTHTYDQPGIYSVTLTAKNGGDSDVEVQNNYIQVIGPAVAFTVAPTAGTSIPHTVFFTDQTVATAPIISWSWNFGDGNSSNLQNPVHTYTTTGVFTVSLTVTDIDGCSRTLTKTNQITVGVPPTFSAAFTPDSILEGGTSTLTFTVDNSGNSLTASALDFTVNLPAGVVVSSPANASTTLTGGTLTAVVGSGTVSYTGGAVAAGSTGTVTVDVTSTTRGSFVMTSGDLTSDFGNSGAASDTLTVNELPSLVVTTTDDEDAFDGETSLREAIAYAATLSGPQEITFSDGTGGSVDFHGAAQVIQISGSELTIASDLTISGPGASWLTIQVNGSIRGMNIVPSAGDVKFIGFKLSGGNPAGANAAGGGIMAQNTGELELIGVELSGNSAVRGGGVASIGTDLKVVNALLVTNTSTGSGVGDGGGGIHVNGGSLTLINSTLSGNTSSRGAGIYLYQASGNLVNITLTGNTAVIAGGGLYAEGVGYSSAIQNSLFAGNTADSGTDPDIGGTSGFTSNGHNIFTEVATGYTAFASDLILAGSGLSTADVLNPVLADNGGATFTHALVKLSPAINAGDQTDLPSDIWDLDGDLDLAEALPVDQRGTGVVRVRGGEVDLGAVEVQNDLPTLVGSGVPDQQMIENSSPLVMDLSLYFQDTEQVSTNLVYRVESNSNSVLVTPTVSGQDLTLTPLSNQSGTADITIRVSDEWGISILDTFTLTVTEQIDLVLSAEESQDPVLAGNHLPGNLTHQIKVTNLGPSQATGVEVDISQTLPAGVTLSSVTPAVGTYAGGTWTIPSLASTHMTVLTLVMEVSETAPGGTDLIKTTGTVSASVENRVNPADDIASVETSITSPVAMPLGLESGLLANLGNSLIEQRVRITNSNPDPVAALRLLIDGLPSDVTVFNAHGEEGGVPFLVLNGTLNPGESVELTVQYSRNSGVANFTPVYRVELLTATEAGDLFEEPDPADVNTLAVTRMISLEDGSILLEWNSEPGKRYYIRYSSDMVTFTTVLPGMDAVTNRTQWVDQGPPQTESHPSTVPTRFYQILEEK
ncbi:PKD domain-containing protein, partial [Kiritimatiellaeota bacterium B1221]|nr:PKD domain-containing protein [Kiritimatiellaeota bacterium B1221]